MIEYKVESWAYGTCHYFEDEFVSVAINGELKYNELLNLADWKAAETLATNKLGELR